jgi:hypothetical protein
LICRVIQVPGKISEIYGDTTVHNGTLALKGEAVYGANTNTGTFELQNNAMLLITGNNNVTHVTQSPNPALL